MPISDDSKKELHEFMMRKMRKCDPQKITENAGQVLWDCLMENFEDIKDRTKVLAYISQDKTIEKAGLATKIANELNNDSDLKSQVLALLGP